MLIELLNYLGITRRKKVKSTFYPEDERPFVVSPTSLAGGHATSGVVRAFLDTDQGMLRPGQLQAYDLAEFPMMPARVLTKIRELSQSQRVLVYEFYHYNTRTLRFLRHGYVVTRRVARTADGRRPDVLLGIFFTGTAWRQAVILRWFAEKVSGWNAVLVTGAQTPQLPIVVPGTLDDEEIEIAGS